MSPAAPGDEGANLLAWGEQVRRDLPWRATRDPWAVLVSEVMLQQTQVVRVVPKWTEFLRRWPTPVAAAAAPFSEVLEVWTGLGYPRRARALHDTAKVVTAEFDGRFPGVLDALLGLPGIGPYTAAAVAAIAFDRPTTILDGNVERVMARLYRVATPLPKAKEELRELASRFTPRQRPGDYAQAIMDLGATICTPTKPKCILCPWREICAAHAADDMEAYPKKLPKSARPQRYGLCYVMIDKQGRIALEKRPEKGLLGGMMQVPTSDWLGEAFDEGAADELAPLKAKWRRLEGSVTHVFTHFALHLVVFAATAVKPDARYQWVEVDNLGNVALPTVMRKVVQHGVSKSA